MNIDRLISSGALVVSCVALALVLLANKNDPLGTDIAKYDFSSPERSLKSLNSMAVKQDARAAWQLFQKIILASSNDSEPKMFLTEGSVIKVIKSIEVQGSATPENNGVIISFVKATINGVEYRNVSYFTKDELGRFFPGKTYSFPYGNDDYGTKPNEQDIAIKAAIEQYKKSGKI